MNNSPTGAEFSECRRYRYALWRIWDEDKPKVMFIGLNPSTADETTNDPTIRRVIRFAKDWGYGGVYMTNLYAWRTPYPSELKLAADKLGDNDRWLDEIAEKCEKIVFAWGSYPWIADRAAEVSLRFDGHALVVNKDGSPRHPLYVKADVVPVRLITDT